METHEEYDIILPPDIKLHRVYEYMPYSYWRIRQILREYYNARLECVRAYKEGRYAGYKQRYYIYDIETGKVLRKNIRLDALRRFLAQQDFPLKEADTPHRNPQAAQFLAIVNAISNNARQ